MNSCPETRRIRDYLSDKMGVEERLDFQEHLDRCPQCRRELRVETAIDLELAREIEAPDVEHAVLRMLRLDEPSRSFGWVDGSFKYLVLAVLLAGLGLLIMPVVIHWPGLPIDFHWFSDRLNWLIGYGLGHPVQVLGIFCAIHVAVALYSLTRLKLLHRLI